jgi:hypothetical protein
MIVIIIIVIVCPNIIDFGSVKLDFFSKSYKEYIKTCIYKLGIIHGSHSLYPVLS